MQPRERLTTKELQVAGLVWQGLTNREIARNIGTTEQVVKNYLQHLRQARGMEPPGIGYLCCRSWRRRLTGRL
jgi:DNA-binding NarL/FixJ family response regulator